MKLFIVFGSPGLVEAKLFINFLSSGIFLGLCCFIVDLINNPNFFTYVLKVSKIDCLTVCYVPATSAGLSRLIFCGGH
jgi:hypothetical protein